MENLSARMRGAESVDGSDFGAEAARAGAMMVDVAMAAKAHRVGRPDNIRSRALVLAVAGGAARNLCGFGGRVMHGRVVAFDAGGIERFAMRLWPAKQARQIDRVGAQCP